MWKNHKWRIIGIISVNVWSHDQAGITFLWKYPFVICCTIKYNWMRHRLVEKMNFTDYKEFNFDE